MHRCVIVVDACKERLKPFVVQFRYLLYSDGRLKAVFQVPKPRAMNRAAFRISASFALVNQFLCVKVQCSRR
jgi:hypothetical protein